MSKTIAMVVSLVDPRLTAPNPIVVLRDDIHTDLLTPCSVQLHAGGKSCRAFGYRRSDFGAEMSERLTSSFASVEAVLSSRVASTLGIDQAQTSTVISLELPKAELRSIASGVADDLADDVVVQYSPKDSALERLGSRGWALATFGGMTAPIRLKSRKHVEGSVQRVRAGMTMRTLWGVPRGPDHRLQLTPIARAPLLRYVTDRRRVGYVEKRGLRVVVAGLSSIVLVSRLLDAVFELTLRVLLRAPQVALRTTQAQPGDDVTDVVRLDPSTFNLLGLTPGGQVIVGWGPRRAIAVALETLPTSSENAERTTRSELLRPTSDSDFPEHLIARVSSSVRLDLQCPASTVVLVRRRVRPVLVANLRQLIIPVASVVVASAAIPNPPKVLLGSAFILMTFFALVPARCPRPPRGSWP